jgi:tripartite-type tricarboxylate transporter receptor subunit TctC
MADGITSVPRRALLRGAALGAGALGARAGLAQQAPPFPSRPIRFVVPFGPGSTADFLARSIANSASPILGQPLVVENRPGAGGIIGADIVAKAPADGYTICLGTIASHAVSAAMATSPLPYDLLNDFDALTNLVNAPNIILVNAQVPARTLAEYLDWARQRGRSTFVSGGNGTTSHLVGEVLRVRYNVPLEHVPYRAFGPALTDVLNGTIDMLSYQIPATLPHIASGALRPLAAATATRVSLMPDLPTVAELLRDNDFDFSAWFGSFVPARTPAPVIARLNEAMQAALASPELRNALPAQGLEPLGWGPERFGPFFRAEVPRWREIVRLTGTKMN